VCEIILNLPKISVQTTPSSTTRTAVTSPTYCGSTSNTMATNNITTWSELSVNEWKVLMKDSIQNANGHLFEQLLQYMKKEQYQYYKMIRENYKKNSSGKISNISSAYKCPFHMNVILDVNTQTTVLHKLCGVIPFTSEHESMLLTLLNLNYEFTVETKRLKNSKSCNTSNPQGNSLVQRLFASNIEEEQDNRPPQKPTNPINPTLLPVNSNTTNTATTNTTNYSIMSMYTLEQLEYLSLNFNAKDSLGATPLHYCASHGNTNAIIILLCTSPTELDRNAVDDYGMSPIHLATKQRHYESVKALMVDSHIEWNKKTRNKYGHTCAHIAAQQMDLPMLKILFNPLNENHTNLETNYCKIYERDNSKRTPLMTAICSAHLNMGSVSSAKSSCMSDFVNLNARTLSALDEYKLYVFLLNECSREDERLSKQKNSYKHDRMIDMYGYNYLHLAAYYNNVRFIQLMSLYMDSSIYMEMLKQISNRETLLSNPLHVACRECNYQVINVFVNDMLTLHDAESLLQTKINQSILNTVDSNGNTPLHLIGIKLSNSKRDTFQASSELIKSLSSTDDDDDMEDETDDSFSSDDITSVVSVLRSNVTLIKSSSPKSTSPITTSIEEKRIELLSIAKLLFENPLVDSSIKNKEDLTAFDILTLRTDYFADSFMFLNSSCATSTRSLTTPTTTRKLSRVPLDKRMNSTGGRLTPRASPHSGISSSAPCLIGSPHHQHNRTQ